MPALQLFLIGAPRSGKTAVFQALTNTPEGPHFTTKGSHHVGTVKVPDARLDGLRDLLKPRRCVPAEATFVDVAVPPSHDGMAHMSQLTPFLSEADAFVVVVQAFGDVDYRGKPLDPAAQLESVLLELTVSDLEKVEHRLKKIEHEKARGLKGSEHEAATLEKGRQHLEKGRALRDLGLTLEEDKLLRPFQFLSLKPAMVIANVAEERLDGSGLDPLRAACANHRLEPLVFCAPLEAELARLDPDAQAAFLKDYGLPESARLRLIHAAYRLLDLISFFTTDGDEVRAWTIRKGTTALAAAGKIHTDMERGFIRAEVVPADVLLKEGSAARCREKGLLKVEGKHYIVRDGDVLHIRFNA